ncbi:MAG: DUF3999 family protein [Chloroflexi bacterium]|nr:DUF3999 family protein [Chloroflexota bacterium]
MAKKRRGSLSILLASAAIAMSIAALAAAPMFAHSPAQAWRFYKPIALPPGISQDSLVEVVPDVEVYANAAPGLADLRIIEAAGESEVPYKLLVESGEQRRGYIAVSVRDLGHLPGQYTTFIADLGREGVLHNELEVLTPSQNFQRGVTLEGSSNGQAWATLQGKGQIFDFTIRERNFTQRYVRVQYPASTARYLRVRIQNGNEPPLDITGATAYFAQELPAQEADMPAAIVERVEDAKEKKTILRLDLGSQGFPSNRLTIATTQQNFYRQVRLESSKDGATWAIVQGSDVLYAYNTPKFIGGKLTLSYPESTYRYFRLTILNEDNPPLPVDGVRIHGFLRKIIFSAAPGATYHLYYGNAQAYAPSYELERVFPYLVTENLPRAQLGSHAANPQFTLPPEPVKPFTERYPWLLPVVVGLASLLIGLFLANLLRQIKKVLPPPLPPA